MNIRPFSDRKIRRLSGLDAGFLSLETYSDPMLIVTLSILRVGVGGALSRDDLLRHLDARLDELPALRWRVVNVPLGLAHPVFVEDAGFHLEDHLCHAVLPEPGGPAELDAACAQLTLEYLNRDRPLWRITLIDGLADGRQALVLQIHHALMDGFALGTTLAQIFSREEPASSPPAGQPGRMPRRVRLVTGALAHNARTLVRLPELIGRTGRATVALRRRQAAATVKVPKAGIDTPLSTINQGFALERGFARASLALEQVLAVKEAAGATVNDVALALVGGALRGYLDARGALPDRPLLAFVPVGMDRPAAIPRAVGNRFTPLTTSLATDVADPWERLRRISAVTAEAKVRLDLAGRELLADWLECIPPMLMDPMVRRGQAASRCPGTPPNHNVLVSNVRGPSVPWQLGSALVEEMYLAPPSTGIGVNFVLWDYAGSLRFGILSFAESIEDPNELAMRLSSSLEELVAAAELRRSGPANVQASFSRWSAAAVAPPAATKEVCTRRAAAW